MSLEIAQREYEGIQILDLKGRLTLGPEDVEFRNRVDQLIAAGALRVALNLGGVHELDSTGLGTLLLAFEKLRKAGGKGAVYNMHPSHASLLVEAQMETALEVFPTEQDAIDSFFPERKIQPYDLLEFVESPAPPTEPDVKPALPKTIR